MEKLQFELGNSYQSIEEFLDHPVRLKKHFSSSVYQELFQKIERLKKEQKERKTLVKTLQSYDTYFSIFLASRYNLTEMEMLTSIAGHQLSKRMKSGFLNQYYSDEFLNAIKNKKKEINSIKTRCCSKLYLLQDAEMISFVKPEIIRVSDYQFNCLNLLKDFFQTFGDIEKILFNQKSIPSYNYAISVLQNKEFQDILKPEVQRKLTEMLEVEMQIKSLKVPKRKELITTLVVEFYQCNGNLCVLLEKMKISELVLLRILVDRLIIGMYGPEVYQDIQNAFQDFQDKKYVLEELKRAKVKSL